MNRPRQKLLSSKLNASSFMPMPLRKALSKRDEPDYIGYIDEIGVGMVRGWAAYRPDRMQRVTVRLHLDEALVAEGPAQDVREDLQKAGYGDGAHGYQFQIPIKALLCAERVVLCVVTDEGDFECARKILREPGSPASPTLYLDASDLIEYLTHHRELSGIQRVQAGYLLSLGNTMVSGTSIRICARFKFSSFFFDVPYDGFVSLLRDAGDVASIAHSAWPRRVRSFKESLSVRAVPRQGDTLFTIGAPWALEDHNPTIRCAKLHDGARYFQIFYDLIPISFPEVVAEPLVPHFARAMAAMSIYADHVFSISRYSMEDLAGTLRALDRPVPEITVVPMGGTITDAERSLVGRSDALGTFGITTPFVLCVGTLEPRKNHLLLLQVWRRLIAKHGVANVPKLVLVGRVGWYMEDFMRMLRVSNYADGSIVHLTGISNADLSELYDTCLFTAFPSLSEGWGLPITESLARGKVCVCSNVTSMPEAGGEHALYIDPLDATGALDLFERLIYDGTTLSTHEANVRETFKARSWDEAAQELKAQLGKLLSQPARREEPTPKAIRLGHTYKLYPIENRRLHPTATEVFQNFLDQEEALDLLAGWHWFELDVHCTWACGPVSTLRLPLPPNGPTDFIVYLGLVVPPCFDDVPIAVHVGAEARGWLRTKAGDHLIVVSLGGESEQPTRELTLQAEGARKPSTDSRLLGIGIATVTVFDRADLAGRLDFCERRIVKQISADPRPR